MSFKNFWAVCKLALAVTISVSRLFFIEFLLAASQDSNIFSISLRPAFISTSVLGSATILYWVESLTIVAPKDGFWLAGYENSRSTRLRMASSALE